MTNCRLVVTLLTLSTTTASAQTAYVSGHLGMNYSRLSNVEVTHVENLHHGGEAIAPSVRIGTRIGQNWGLEIGFTRPEPVVTERDFGFPVSLLSVPGAAPRESLSALETQNHYERRDETLETAIWVSQSLASRLSLVYLGGVAFNRTVEEITTRATRRTASGTVFPVGARSTIYALAPMLGLDMRVRLAGHVYFVPGVRLQGIGPGASDTAGWLIRPSAGMLLQF